MLHDEPGEDRSGDRPARSRRERLPGHRHRLPRARGRRSATTPASTRCASRRRSCGTRPRTASGWSPATTTCARRCRRRRCSPTRPPAPSAIPTTTCTCIPQNLDGKAHVDCRHVVNPWFSPGLGQAPRTTRPRALRRHDRGAASRRSLRHDGRLRHDVRHRDVPRHPRPAGRGRGVHAAAGRDDLPRVLRWRSGRAGRCGRRDQAVLRAGHRGSRRAAPATSGPTSSRSCCRRRWASEPITPRRDPHAVHDDHAGRAGHDAAAPSATSSTTWRPTTSTGSC